MRQLTPGTPPNDDFDLGGPLSPEVKYVTWPFAVVCSFVCFFVSKGWVVADFRCGRLIDNSCKQPPKSWQTRDFVFISLLFSVIALKPFR